MKHCSKCDTWKDTSEFSKNRRAKDGLFSWCKKCATKNAMKWQKENSKQVSEYQQAYRKTHPRKDKSKQYPASQKKWRLNNPDKVKEKIKNWFAKHPGKKRELREKYEALHPEDRQARRRGYRARKRNAQGKITPQEWQAILGKYGNKCLKCGKTNIQLTMDHVLPLALGGTHTADNVQPLCMSCNASKNAKHIDYRT